MNWYIKLFAPAIVAAILVGAGILLAWLDFDALLPNSDKALGFIIVSLVTWGAVQTLYFPKRPHKSRMRVFLLVAIGAYAFFFSNVLIVRNTGEEWLFLLFGGALVASIAFGLRYRSSPYSLAPGWSQLKFLGVLFGLIGLTILLLYGLDQVFFKIFKRSSLERDFGPFFLIAWAITSAGGIISYYVEAILHHRRNSMKNWEKSINKMGDE